MPVDVSLVQAVNHDVTSLAELAFPRPGSASVVEHLRPAVKRDPTDRSMKINVSTPSVDTAFQKAKIWEAQRALTYGGRWG